MQLPGARVPAAPGPGGAAVRRIWERRATSRRSAISPATAPAAQRIRNQRGVVAGETERHEETTGASGSLSSGATVMGSLEGAGGAVRATREVVSATRDSRLATQSVLPQRRGRERSRPAPPTVAHTVAVLQVGVMHSSQAGTREPATLRARGSRWRRQQPLTAHDFSSSTSRRSRRSSAGVTSLCRKSVSTRRSGELRKEAGDEVAQRAPLRIALGDRRVVDKGASLHAMLDVPLALQDSQDGPHRAVPCALPRPELGDDVARRRGSNHSTVPA
jgi:hypothetical protein